MVFHKKGVVVLALIVLLVSILSFGCAKAPASNPGFIDIDVDAPQNTPSATGNDIILPAATPDASSALGPERTIEVDPNATPTPTPKYHAAELDGTDDATPIPKRTYAEYRTLNSDVVGWIKIDDTEVDEPIVHGTDNEYYLTHSVEKTASKSGTVFLDSRVNVGSKHMILFGHNMKNGSMFNGLNNYSQSSFYKNHRTFTVKWGDTETTYKVFAVYTVDLKKARYMGTQFADENTFSTYMNELAALSKYDVDTTIKGTDHVLTLSTCNRTDYSNGRFVVHAVKVEG